MSSHSSFHPDQIKYLPARTTAYSADDLETASKSSFLPQSDKAILQVIDAPFDGSARPRSLREFKFGDGLAEGLATLPPHPSGTARILDVTVHSDFLITGLRDTKGPQITQHARDALINYLQYTYMQSFEERRVFRWLSDPLLVNDIGSISSQWTQRLGDRDTKFSRVVNRSSLQQHPLDLDVRPRDSYLTCAREGQDRLLVIIVNDVSHQQTFQTNKSRHDSISFENPSCASNLLKGTSLTIHSDQTLESFAQLLVLDFFFASIYLQRADYYEPLIYPKLPEKEALKLSLNKNPHLQVPLGLFEPRLAAKSEEAFKEIEDAEGILRNVANLEDSIDFVIGELSPKVKEAIQTPGKLSIIKLCREREQNAQRALEALNRQLDYLAKRHAIREAKAIKILTVLASIYLPLSLSASLLGMQSPLKVIARDNDGSNFEPLGTNLLFDFFGVFIVLATGTIFIVHAIRLSLWLKSNGLRRLSKHYRGSFSIFYYGRHWKYDGLGGRMFDWIRVFTKWWLGGMLCITLLVIFLTGMLTTAQNAWNTAKWLFVTYIVVGFLSIALYFGTYNYLYYKRVGHRSTNYRGD